ncbi:MAG: hypothetical protein QOF33_3883 [Thermomicrobiales bacterium]|nr:hypothetical protein [Thermomicrobiales bacterium]
MSFCHACAGSIAWSVHASFAPPILIAMFVSDLKRLLLQPMARREPNHA